MNDLVRSPRFSVQVLAGIAVAVGLVISTGVEKVSTEDSVAWLVSVNGAWVCTFSATGCSFFVQELDSRLNVMKKTDNNNLVLEVLFVS